MCDNDKSRETRVGWGKEVGLGKEAALTVESSNWPVKVEACPSGNHSDSGPPEPPTMYIASSCTMA